MGFTPQELQTGTEVQVVTAQYLVLGYAVWEIDGKEYHKQEKIPIQIVGITRPNNILLWDDVNHLYVVTEILEDQLSQLQLFARLFLQNDLCTPSQIGKTMPFTDTSIGIPRLQSPSEERHRMPMLHFTPSNDPDLGCSSRPAANKSDSGGQPTLGRRLSSPMSRWGSRSPCLRLHSRSPGRSGSWQR